MHVHGVLHIPCFADAAAGHLGMNVAVFEPLKMIGGMGAAGIFEVL